MARKYKPDTQIPIAEPHAPWVQSPPVSEKGWGSHPDFELTDLREDDNDCIIVSGRYLTLKPDSIMLDNGFEIKARDVFTRYFAYKAFAESESHGKKIDGMDVSVNISVIDHRVNKELVLCAILINTTFQKDIYISTKQGYGLWFKNDKRLMKVCEQDKKT